MSSRVNIGAIRRQEIIDAAWAIIAERGIQKLSLSEIEKKVGMSRGQLTYYFKAKEDILLAVFDRLVDQWRRRGRPGDGDPRHPLGTASWEEAVAWIMRMVLSEREHQCEFHALQYTFLSQVGHRDDFRDRLARLYAEWRRHMAEHLADSLKRRPTSRRFAPRVFASVVQAMIHGLAMQSVVDPDAFAAAAAVKLCMDLLENYLWPRNRQSAAKVSRKSAAPRNGAPKRITKGSRNGRSTTSSLNGKSSAQRSRT
ncbi:MAG: TetR/AcrR family transcriptional regulator [Gemmataceae bacterium]